MKTRVTELLGIEVPVIQGAMARIANASLAGAVSKAGGLGVIACGGAPLEWIEEQVSLVRSMTDKPIGANVMLMDPERRQDGQAARRPAGGRHRNRRGKPGNLHRRCGRKPACKVVPVVASSGAGRAHGTSAEPTRWWPRGTESGGHIGELTTMALVPAGVRRGVHPRHRARAALPTAAAWRPRSRWAPRACSWERASSRWRNALLADAYKERVRQGEGLRHHRDRPWRRASRRAASRTRFARKRAASWKSDPTGAQRR